MTWDKQRVLQLRKGLGLTQSELARELGCRQQTVSEWELGLYEPANAYGRLLTMMESQIRLSQPLWTAPANNHSVATKSQPTSKLQPRNSEPAETAPIEFYAPPLDKPFDPAID